MKIAVVDDERPARKELISQILDVKPDCIVKEADSGGSALELFNKEDDFDMFFIFASPVFSTFSITSFFIYSTIF